MKKSQGIFDAISDELHSEIANKADVIKNRIIYHSESLKIEGFSMETLKSKSVASEDSPMSQAGDAMKNLRDKATDPFKLIGFSKEDMQVDKSQIGQKMLDTLDSKKQSEKLDTAIDSSGKELLRAAKDKIKEADADLMKVASKKWQSKFNNGFDS
ncbi:MAG: hypothetical protein ABJG47_14785 [Ekhidna sp.]